MVTSFCVEWKSEGIVRKKYSDSADFTRLADESDESCCDYSCLACEQFLYETPVASFVDDTVQDLVAVWNLQIQVFSVSIWMNT
jgi:hypothetical protein